MAELDHPAILEASFQSFLAKTPAFETAPEVQIEASRRFFIAGYASSLDVVLDIVLAARNKTIVAESLSAMILALDADLRRRYQ